MRSFTSLPLLGLVVASVSALVGAVAIDEQCQAEICMGGQTVTEVARSVPGVEPLTNAERLSLGLPLKAPTRRHHAARSQTSPTPQNSITGKIQVTNTANNAVLGFLSTVTTDAGNIKASTNEAEAMKFSIGFDIGSTSGSQLRVTMLNSPGPLLGLVQGRDNTNSDIASDSYQYTYLNGISLPGSGPGATPSDQTSIYTTKNASSRDAETDIWTVDLATGDMSAQWINTDGSAPQTILFMQSGYMYAGGSTSQFQARYPSPVTTVSLKFIRDTDA